MENRKKIGIVTISENVANYGQRLQCYMVQQLLTELGYDSEMIQDARWYNNPLILKTYWKDIAHILLRYHYKPSYHGFRIMMYKWIKKNLKLSSYYIKKDSDMAKLPSMYDGFITGSDQVWNPYYTTRGLNSFTTLQFAPRDQRVAYAASIASNDVPKERVEEFKEYLIDFGPIAMREESGARIVKELTGRDVPVVLDPTLMWTGEQWAEKFMREPQQSHYMVVFLYYNLIDEYRRKAEEIASQKNLSIIYLNEMDSICDYSVESWLGFIKNADYIMTDSFHCSVFSILFHKNILVVRHLESEKVMGSRIIDLLNLTQIPTTTTTTTTTTEGDMDFLQTNVEDWNKVDSVLETKRQESMRYLSSVFPPQK